MNLIIALRDFVSCESLDVNFMSYMICCTIFKVIVMYYGRGAQCRFLPVSFVIFPQLFWFLFL